MLHKQSCRTGTDTLAAQPALPSKAMSPIGSSFGLRGPYLILAFIRASPAQPDLVLPEMGRNVGDDSLHADAFPGAVLSRHLAG